MVSWITTRRFSDVILLLKTAAIEDNVVAGMSRFGSSSFQQKNRFLLSFLSPSFFENRETAIEDLVVAGIRKGFFKQFAGYFIEI